MFCQNSSAELYEEHRIKLKDLVLYLWDYWFYIYGGVTGPIGPGGNGGFGASPGIRSQFFPLL